MRLDCKELRYLDENKFFIKGEPKERWTKEQKFAFCAYACHAPMGYDVLNELKYHGISVARFDEWFKEWDDNGRPQENEK